MPGRPPRAWMAACVAEVTASGTARDPVAVCGAVWARKTPAQKAAAVRTYEGGGAMAKKAKKHAKKAKKHGKAKGDRCSACKHGRKMHTRAGCASMKGSSFCNCPRFAS